MMEIERKFHDEALRQAEIEDAEEDKEELVQMVRQLGERMDRKIKILNVKKQAWFEGLAGSVLEFAEACSFNVKMWITDGLLGIIRLESSFFELDWRDAPQLHVFWSHLQLTADAFNISLCEEVFRIEFHFYLYSAHDPE